MESTMSEPTPRDQTKWMTVEERFAWIDGFGIVTLRVYPNGAGGWTASARVKSTRGERHHDITGDARTKEIAMELADSWLKEKRQSVAPRYQPGVSDE